MVVESIGTWWMWAGFFAFVIAVLALDLFVLGGNAVHRMSVKEAAGWSVVWVVVALAFNAGLWWHVAGIQGDRVANEKALEFFTGYLIEKSLALDNLFVWLMLFRYFDVPAEYQRRVLLYGVLGAIVMRTVMILAGAWLIARFHWVLYLFGLFLIITGVKMLIFADQQPDLEKNPVLRWMRGHLKIAPAFHAERFFVTHEGSRHATPLFLVLVLVEITDLVFAVDSIPAIFAITEDPFIVLTSNIFAILGLRAMYFLLRDIADRFHLIKYGLAIVLLFVGAKMLLADLYKIPIVTALLVVALILSISIIASLLTTRRHATKAP